MPPTTHYSYSMAASSGQAEDVKLEPAAGASAAEDRCPICLEDYKDKAFVDACFHAFCFECISRSAEVGGAKCPMCKTEFKVVIHNVRANDDYDVFRVKLKSTDSSRLPINLEEALRTFRGYRTTILPGQLRPHPTAPPSTSSQSTSGTMRQRVGEIRPTAHVATTSSASGSSATSRSHGRRRKKPSSEGSRKPAPLERRRAVYSLGLRAKPLEERDGRKLKIRDISPAFFRENPACVHRLVPWLTREFKVLVGEEHVEFLIQIVLSLIDKINLDSSDFANHLSPFLNEKTPHFVHEFISFAKSPYDMVAYDDNVRYDWPENHPIRRESSGWDDEDTTTASSQPGPSGLSSYNTDEDMQRRILEELTATRWDDSPPLTLSSLSPVLIHDSDSELPIVISDDDNDSNGEEGGESHELDGQALADNPLGTHSNDQPSQDSAALSSSLDVETSSIAENLTRNSQATSTEAPTNDLSNNGGVTDGLSNNRPPDTGPAGSTTDCNSASDTASSEMEISTRSTLTESRLVTSSSEVTSTTLTDPIVTVHILVPQNDDIIGQSSSCTNTMVGQSSRKSDNNGEKNEAHSSGTDSHTALPLQPSSTESPQTRPARTVDEGERDDELSLFADEDQFPSAGLIDVAYTDNQTSNSDSFKHKEESVVSSPTTTVTVSKDNDSRKKLSKGDKDLSTVLAGDKSTRTSNSIISDRNTCSKSSSSSSSKGTEKDSEAGRSDQKQSSKLKQDSEMHSSTVETSNRQRNRSRKRSYDRHERYKSRSRSRSRGKSPRRDLHGKHRHRYYSNSSEDELYSGRHRVKSKHNSFKKNRNSDDSESEYKSSRRSKERSRRHRSREENTGYHGDHDYDRQLSRCGSPYYKREGRHRTKLYSDDFTVDRTERCNIDKKRKDSYYKESRSYHHHCKRSRGFQSRSRSCSPSSEENSKHRSRKKKTGSTRRFLSSPGEEGESDVGDESRKRLSQELSELDEQIKENKKELLKSMLRRERMELIQRHLHQSSPTVETSEHILKSHKPVDCSVASANEMVEELVFLDQAIVDGKKQLLKVMKQMEEDQVDKDGD